MNLFSLLFKRKKKTPKIGIALGSGGAKGFAELGALYAFEQNGIEFDYIAGTSIGSIIGAFLANGYSSVEILELLRRVNVKDIKNSFMINMDTSGLFDLIDKNIGVKDIEELKKPFGAIATNLDTGKEKVFLSGSVGKVLSASSCYPPFFKPVLIDGESFVDGAFTNSIPADVVKEMGADYIIGIDLSVSENKGGVLSRIFPTYKSSVENPSEKGYKYSNVILHPDLTGYSSLSFNDGMEMYDIGYKCAIEMMPQILNDLQKLKKKK